MCTVDVAPGNRSTATRNCYLYRISFSGVNFPKTKKRCILFENRFSEFEAKYSCKMIPYTITSSGSFYIIHFYEFFEMFICKRWKRNIFLVNLIQFVQQQTKEKQRVHFWEKDFLFAFHHLFLLSFFISVSLLFLWLPYVISDRSH